MSVESPAVGTMNRSDTCLSGQTRAVSQGEMDSLKASPVKKRKSSRLGSVLRKLLGRKNNDKIKSQISLPTPTAQIEDVSATCFTLSPNSLLTTLIQATADFITSATDPRYQRAVSLPVQHVSRTSALGSHKPFSHISEEKPISNAAEPIEDIRPPRPRRASMPNTYSMTPEPLADYTMQDEQAYQQQIDEANIGYAVTSGSHPRRRSRSADALHDAIKDHRMSPIQWRHLRQRSDEIRYWRDSIGPVDIALPEPDDDEAQRNVQTDELDAIEQEQKPASPISEYKDAQSEEDSATADSDKENRQTFDFGILASSMNEQEHVPIDERVMTIEVKLMDLEYAISKLQARSPSPAAPPAHLPQSTSHLATPTSKPEVPTTSALSEQGSNSTTSATTNSTATAPSLHTIPSQIAVDPFATNKTRPTSVATTLRPPDSPLQERFVPPKQDPHPRPKRSSITSITIDHYATLINLVRREQAARIRLEDQVAELQREMFLMKAKAQVEDGSIVGGELRKGASETSFSGRRGWGTGNSIGEVREARKAARSEIRPMRSFDDESTEGGYEDVYETPTEVREARREWEGFGEAARGIEGRVF